MRRALSLMLLLCAGCADQTAILVEVRSSSLAIPADVDALRIEAHSATGTMADETFPLSGTWPQSVAIRPGAGDDRADVAISVTGLLGGAFVVRRVVAHAPFRSGETSVVRVELDAACRGVMCDPGVDCVGGTCEGAAPDAGVDAGGGPLDAGGEPDASAPDGGMDAGTIDAGSADAGFDAGGPDAGRPDAGRDAGTDAGTDACAAEICNGVDDDCDTLVDEGLPCPGSLVISELAATGPAGAADEFVELYNRTPHAIDLTGLGIFYRSFSGAAYARRALLPAGASIPGYGFYLITGTGYAGAATGDLSDAWSSVMAGAGGHVRISLGTTDLDTVGWGTAMFPEGTAVAGLPDLSPGSYERKANAASTVASMAAGGADVARGNGQDTNDNGADFLQRAAREPQNASAPTESP